MYDKPGLMPSVSVLAYSQMVTHPFLSWSYRQRTALRPQQQAVFNPSCHHAADPAPSSLILLILEKGHALAATYFGLVFRRACIRFIRSHSLSPTATGSLHVLELSWIGKSIRVLICNMSLLPRTYRGPGPSLSNSSRWEFHRIYHSHPSVES